MPPNAVVLIGGPIISHAANFAIVGLCTSHLRETVR